MSVTEILFENGKQNKNNGRGVGNYFVSLMINNKTKHFDKLNRISMHDHSGYLGRSGDQII